MIVRLQTQRKEVFGMDGLQEVFGKMIPGFHKNVKKEGIMLWSAA